MAKTVAEPSVLHPNQLRRHVGDCAFVQGQLRSERHTQTAAGAIFAELLSRDMLQCSSTSDTGMPSHACQNASSMSLMNSSPMLQLQHAFLEQVPEVTRARGQTTAETGKSSLSRLDGYGRFWKAASRFRSPGVFQMSGRQFAKRSRTLGNRIQQTSTWPQNLKKLRKDLKPEAKQLSAPGCQAGRSEVSRRLRLAAVSSWDFPCSGQGDFLA